MPTTRYWTSVSDGDLANEANLTPAADLENNDTLILSNSAIDIDSGDLSAIQLAVLKVYMSFIGRMGTGPANGAAGAPLKIGATNVRIGVWDGVGTMPRGSKLINLDLGAEPCTVVIENTASAGEPTHIAPVRLVMNDVASKVFLNRGRCCIAAQHPSEVAVLDAVKVGELGAPSSMTEMAIGAGVTFNELTVNGGRTLLDAACPDIVQWGGLILHTGIGGVANEVIVNRGIYVPTTTGTIVKVTVKAGAKLDLSRSDVEREITDIVLEDGSHFISNPAVTATIDDQRRGKGSDMQTLV